MADKQTINPLNTYSLDPRSFSASDAREVFETAHAMLAKTCPMASLSIEQIADRYNGIYREYARALLDAGYGIKKSVLSKKDTIDFRPLIPGKADDPVALYDYPLRRSPDYMDYLMSRDTMEKAMCLAVPPFSDFVFRLNDCRWVHVELLEVDLPNWTVSYRMQDYMLSQGIFNPCVKCDATVVFSEIKGEEKEQMRAVRGQGYPPVRADIMIKSGFNPPDINKLIPYSQLGWGPVETTIWEAYDTQYSTSSLQKLKEKGTDNCFELARLIIMYIGMTNYMLYANKPVISRKERPDARPQAQQPSAPKTDSKEPPAPPERRVRTVGTVKITSRDIPRRPTMETIRRYKVAVWKARGGVRHMKDGRLIPFRECVKHRKALEGTPFAEQNATPAQTVLRLKDNREVLPD